MATCKPCGKSFAQDSHLQQHQKDKHPKSYCTRCNCSFDTKAAKKRHVAASNNHHVCPACPHRPDFETQAVLGTHLDQKHSYCARCDRFFDSEESKKQHLTDSASHHVCWNCATEPDFKTEDKLDKHLERVHSYCIPCDEFFDDNEELRRHDVESHHKCKTCGRYFQAASTLKSHTKTHAPEDIECLGCTLKFKTDSAMIMHLEAGNCVSDVDAEDVRIAAFGSGMSSHWKADSGQGYDYKCPNCDDLFVSMGALMQHAECDVCDGVWSREDWIEWFLDDLAGSASA